MGLFSVPNMNILVKDIIVGERYRLDYKDLDELAESISTKGLMHPPVIDDQNNLIAGGRRLAAIKLLGWAETPVTRFGTLSAADRTMLELEENLQRSDATWQETTLGIASYHRLAKSENNRKGEAWSQSATGRLLNLDQSSISNALLIAKELSKDSTRSNQFWKAGSLTDAIKLKIAERHDEASKETYKRLTAKRAQLDKNPALAKATVTITPRAQQDGNLSSPHGTQDASELRKAGSSELRAETLTRDAISRFYYHGDSLNLIPQIAKSTLINHIICDPPYGIEMENLSSDTSRVNETHGVSDNLKLWPEFLKVAFDNIASDGFLCAWYDLDHHEKIAEWAKKIGWKVTRWPLVWCKTSPSQNQAAQYNITKATEVCYIMRRSEKSIIKTKQSRNFILADSETSATHPFVKPQPLWNYLLETVSIEQQTILDPFAGEGSSLVSSFKLNRIPLGIEIDDKHIANGIEFIHSRVNAPSQNAILSSLPL